MKKAEKKREETGKEAEKEAEEEVMPEWFKKQFDEFWAKANEEYQEAQLAPLRKAEEERLARMSDAERAAAVKVVYKAL